MTLRFKVGEVVIIQSKTLLEFNGQEAIILSKPMLSRNGYCYRTDNPPPGTSEFLPYWSERALRKLPPPDTISSWEDCAFKPRELIGE